MQIDDKISATALYEIYGQLLTSKQQEIFEEYYYEDNSIIEIAEDKEITKNAVYNSIQKSLKLLEKYENTLMIQQRYQDNIRVLKENNVKPEIVEQIK